MVEIATLHKQYNTFLNTIISWLRDKSYDINADARVTVTKQGTDFGIVKTVKPIYCRDWLYREGSKDKIDIIADIQETISLQKGFCIESTIRVAYYRVENKTTVIASENLHYDCKVPPENKHPICHVQNSSTIKIDLPDSFIRTRTNTDDTQINGRCQTMRVPSAFVNLPGLMAIIAADHMKNEHWTDFSNFLMTKAKVFPAICPSSVQKVLDNCLCAWSWYCNA